MNQHRVKALPVVDEDRRVIGIVTVYDLFNLDVADLAPVTSVMTSPVVTVRPDAPVADLVALMTDRDLRHVPVVDADHHLLGIVTRRELIAVMHQLLLH
jgi:CBS domain-containing membrane protein